MSEVTFTTKEESPLNNLVKSHKIKDFGDSW